MRAPVTDIHELVEEEISTVAFVRDYVEFHFDGPVLSSISNPSVFIEGVEYRFPEPGSREALCRVIGSEVSTLNLQEGKALELTTNNNLRIKIPLDPESFRGDEAMHSCLSLRPPCKFGNFLN